MSWHRDPTGLWCPCFQAYQPDDGTGCPAFPCPENTHLSAVLVSGEPSTEEQPR